MARLIGIGIERGVFEDRDPYLAAVTVSSMAIAPLVLYHSGRIESVAMRDRLAEEMLDAAMRYLG